ncbi:hypothetical protein WSM22_17970 [Cytophagales bacterium WSM2-2]|nr:hypothetical protein WSM22_17970 [Cytophagales bacterium WSM2-2]
MIFIVFLISISLTIALIFLGVFFLNLKSGQYEDTYTPSIRMLFDDKPIKEENRKDDLFITSISKESDFESGH